MESRYCSNCIHFSSTYSYCRQFKIKITSIGNAAICTGVSSKSEKIKSLKDKSVTRVKRCKDCKNLFFESYCKEEKINIKNIYKSIVCVKFIDKNTNDK